MKRTLAVLIFATAFSVSPIPFGNLQAASQNLVLAASNSSRIYTRQVYDEYGRQGDLVEILLDSNGAPRKARLRGYRYEDNEWFSVSKGTYRCGDKTFHYRFWQWGQTDYYFNF